MRSRDRIDMRGRTVLIVDDKYAVAQEYASRIAALGAVVTGYARTAWKARQIVLSGTQVDVTLLDLDVCDDAGMLARQFRSLNMEVVLTTRLPAERLPIELRSFRRLSGPAELAMHLFRGGAALPLVLASGAVHG